MRRWDLVELVWIDSSHEGGWLNEDEVGKKPHTTICYTAGYFYREIGANLQFVMNYCCENTPDEQVCGLMTIPKVSIKKKRIIRRYRCGRSATSN